MSQLNHLSIGFLNLIGMKFKFMKTWMKPIKLFYIHFLPYMIVSFQRKQKKEKKKTKDKIYYALG